MAGLSAAPPHLGLGEHHFEAGTGYQTGEAPVRVVAPLVGCSVLLQQIPLRLLGKHLGLRGPLAGRLVDAAGAG